MISGPFSKKAALFWLLCISLLGLGGCSRSKVEVITVKGSDTEVNLVQELAENFMEADPDISLTITGGGSGYGIAALINQKTDIANSSRPLNTKEEQLVKKQGITVYPVIFAQDAIAVVVHPQAKVSELSLEDVGRVFRGDVKSWKELGGADIPISLYGRQSNSGTFVYFREKILKGEYDASIKQMNGTAQLIEAVKQDPGGAGYVGIGYLLGKKEEAASGIVAVALREEGKPFISPLDKEAIISGRYPVIRPLFQFLNGAPKGKGLEFLRYELSPEGQKVVEKNGYFEISAEQRAQNAALGIGL